MSSSKKPSMSMGLAAFKFKMQTRITGLERQKKQRKEEFGVEYLQLLTSNTNKKYAAKVCLQKAVQDMNEINQEIERCYDEMENRERGEMDEKIQRRENHHNQESSPNERRGRDDNNISVSDRSDGASSSQGGRGRGQGRGGRHDPMSFSDRSDGASSSQGGRGRGQGRGGRYDPMSVSDRSDGASSSQGGRGRGQGRGGRHDPMSFSDRSDGASSSQGGRGRGQGRGGRYDPMSVSDRSDGASSSQGGRGRGRARGRGRGAPGRGGGGRGGPVGRGRGGPQGRGRGRGMGRGRGRGAGHIPPMSPGVVPLDPERRLPKRVDHREAFQQRHSPEGKRSRLSAVNLALAPEAFKPGHNIEKWTHSEWKFREYKTKGGWTQTTEGLVEKFTQKSIKRGIEKFKKHPQLFIAMMYPTPMLEWPENEQEYTLIYRDGTTGLCPKGVTSRGQVAFLMHEYQPLPSLPKDELPKKNRDEYTDQMTYRNQKLVTKKLPAYLPGRGTGLLDDPRIKIIGDIDPSDIAQGQVGDCWLLSGIASLAEFNGAINRLFRKTENLDQMPFADGRPNMYTVTLWDLTTWEEVDIVVDERLPARKDIKGALFGAKATEDGELWLCYLEKAIAAHCGGWDKIDGGQCTHAWSLLTGCKDQYIIQRVPENPEKGPFGMWAKYDPEAEEWAPHANSPSEGHLGVWRVPWPELGGGGVDDLDENALFLRLCAWSDQNYLIGASSKGDSDRNSTNGVVDNHAYSVIDCRNDVAGTGYDMIQVRNPWGYGGIENGQFARKGKGWKDHPEIQKALQYKELEEDDGVFWVTKEEFFKHYHAIYVGAMNMKTFLGIEEYDEIATAVNKHAPVVDPTGGLPSAPLFDEELSDEENNEKSSVREEERVTAPESPKSGTEDEHDGIVETKSEDSEKEDDDPPDLDENQMEDSDHEEDPVMDENQSETTVEMDPVVDENKKIASKEMDPVIVDQDGSEDSEKGEEENHSEDSEHDDDEEDPVVDEHESAASEEDDPVVADENESQSDEGEEGSEEVDDDSAAGEDENLSEGSAEEEASVASDENHSQNSDEVQSEDDAEEEEEDPEADDETNSKSS